MPDENASIAQARENLERSGTALPSLEIGMLLHGADGIILSCDPVAEHLLGYGAHQLVGTMAFAPAWHTIHPDGSALMSEDAPPIFALRTGQSCRNVALGIYRSQGDQVWLCFDSTLLFQPDLATPSGVVTLIREQVQSATAAPPTPSAGEAQTEPETCQPIAATLQASEQRFHRLADSMPYIVFAARPNGSISYANHFARQYTGLNDELLENGWVTCIHPDDRNRAFQSWMQAVQTGEPYEMECRYRKADGTYRWLLSQGLPIRDSEGQIVEWVGGCMDIDDRKRAEVEREKLLKREQLLRTTAEIAEMKLNQLLTSLREDFVLFDRDWRIAYLNAQAAKTMRLNQEEALGSIFWDLFPDLIGTEFYDRCHQVMVDRIPLQFEYYYPAWDRWFENRVYPTPDGIVNLCTDITQRKRTEVNTEFLNQLDLRLRQLSTAKMMVDTVVSSVGEYLDIELCVWHEVDWEHRLAIVEHPWQRGNLPDLTGTYDLEAFFTPQQLELCAAGQPLIICDVTTNVGTAPYAQNYLALGIRALISVPCLQSGHWVACLSVGTARARTWQADEVELLQTIVSRLWSLIEHTRAIQELYQSEAELRQKNAILDIINQSAPTPIFVKDRQGRIIYANPATLDVLGKTAEEVIGHRDCDLYPHLADALDVMENDRRIMESGQMEVVEESPDGVRTFLGMKVPYRDESGTVIGLIGISNDISDRVQLERDRECLLQQEQTAREAAENANRIKDEFLAVVSHELRTPLNPILGWARLLQQGKLSAAETSQALATIARNAQLQAQLIDDLLDISRILRGKLSLESLPVDLGAVITAALETVRLAAEAKSLYIDTNLSSTCRTVMGDAGRLQQVVWNLLSNAVKFTPAGGRVSVELAQVGQSAQIQITDTGKGIHPDFLPHVFKHFRQEDSATTRKFGGLGLGLAIARQIVELHGGRIFVASPGEDQGATFTVQIPLAAQQTQGDLSSAIADSDFTNNLRGTRIFVVDDERDSRDFVVFVLEQAGAIVTSFASGFETLQALETSSPDLIISDIGMPDMDGYMLLQQVRANESSQQIPAIALTAYAGEFDRQQSLKAGFQKHVAKPVEPTELVTNAACLCGRSGGTAQ